MTKERPEQFAQKRAIHSKKFDENRIFYLLFYCFSPFLCQRANRSRRSLPSCSFLKSYCEQITQVALNKRATVRDSLLSLFTKEQPWAIHSGLSWQKINHERFIQVSHDKRSTMSNSFRSLMTKDQPWAIHSSLSWQKSNHERFIQVYHDKRAMAANRSFALSLTKNERIAQKTDDQISNPDLIFVWLNYILLKKKSILYVHICTVVPYM